MSNKTLFFDQLVRAYAKDLYRYAFWMSKDANVAEDLVQETFSRAWKALDKLQDEQAAKAWLMTILRRENARRFEKQSPEWVAMEEAMIADSIDREPERQMERQALYQAILSLDAQFKEPLLLQVLWGFSGDEIADQLGLKLATVNTRLFRARQQLKQQLERPSATVGLKGNRT